MYGRRELVSAMQTPFLITKGANSVSVHKALTNHAKKLNSILTQYANLDRERELHIEEALSLYERGLPFATDNINSITTQMNKLSKQIENLPPRKLVTKEMVEEYANRK